MVVAAIDKLQTDVGVSLLALTEATGLDKKTVFSSIRIATVQAGVQIEQEGPLYRLMSWGPALVQEGAELALRGRLNGRFVQDGVTISDPLPPPRAPSK